jgi:two-component sensor histidine kinase
LRMMPYRTIDNVIEGAVITFIDITQRKKIEKTLGEKTRLNKILLDAFPCVALLIRPSDREIIASNAAAARLGAIPGTDCFKTWWNNQDACPWCLTPEKWDGEAHHQEVESEGVFLDVNWIPVDTDLYMHFAFDISESKRSEVRIRNLLAEKEIILKEVHHRIKNNMSTVYGLLSLQAGNTDDPGTKSALNDAGMRVQSMITLYDKLYQSASFNEMPANKYLLSLIDQITGNFPNSGLVKIEKNIGEFTLSSKTLSTMGIIINELLTNIMKYAFTGRNEGLIVVTVLMKDGKVIITIQDNGIGIPDTIDIENSTGFGLQLVSMLTKQMEGTISLERVNGTKVMIEFPYNNI